MNFKTLTRIHELLKHDLEVKEAAKKQLRNLKNMAEETGSDNYKELNDLYEIKLQEFFEAERILADFEDSDWHC